MSAWQPIETAPTDGSDVLLWDGKIQTVGWSFGGRIWHAYGGRFVPTHWMPLPEPPK